MSKYVAIMFSNVLSQLRTKFRIFAHFSNFGMHIFFSLSSSKGIEILLQFSAKLLNFCTKELKNTAANNFRLKKYEKLRFYMSKQANFNSLFRRKCAQPENGIF